MCGQVGREVTFLKRVKIGELPLDEQLKPGEMRELTPEEYALVMGKKNA